MRNLAQGKYSDAQVKLRLTDPNFAFGKRFEILDRNFNVVGELDTVTSAQVEHSIDRDHKGALTLTLDAFEDLRGQMLRYLIRPYFQIGMLDGGMVEYPYGAYLWVDPERQLPNVHLEEWSVTLADQTWRLSLASPGAAGFLVRKGQLVTDVIRDIYRDKLGYTDLSGIADSDATIAETKFWKLKTPNTPEYGLRKDMETQRDNAWRDMSTEFDTAKRALVFANWTQAMNKLRQLDVTSPAVDETFVTWGAILSQLQAGIGFTSPYFDWTGERPIAVPATDLTSAGADHHYATDDRSVLVSLAVSPDISSIGNRVLVTADNADGYYGLAEADANDLFPNHPLAQKFVKDYIDIPISDSIADTSVVLQARANKELGERLARHTTASVELRINPAHEPYDLVGLSWTDDPDFGAGEKVFTQRGMTVPLDNPAACSLDLGLVVQ